MPQRQRRRLGRILHRLYLSGLTIQALIGGSQLIGALALQIAIRNGWMARLMAQGGRELAEDPTDPLARWLVGVAHAGTLGSETFWSLYLIGHGVLNLGVVIALLAKRPWAHPLSIVVLSGFIVYQMDRWTLNHSPVMIALSLFDAVVIALVWREYRALRRGSHE